MRLTNHPVTIAALAVVLAFPFVARAGPKPAGAAAAMPPSGAKPEARHAGQRAEAAEARKAAPPLVEAKPPPFSEGIFPCSGCHTEPGDRTRRQLAFHEEHPGDLRPRLRAPLVPRLPRRRRTATC